MAKDLHKRLEEAAKKSVYRQYNCKGKYPCASYKDCEMCGGYNTPFDCCECGAGDYNEGFLDGAEYGFKEAIKVTSEWMKTNIANQVEMMCAEGPLMMSKKAFLADFENEMLKLL